MPEPCEGGGAEGPLVEDEVGGLSALAEHQRALRNHWSAIDGADKVDHPPLRGWRLAIAVVVFFIGIILIFLMGIVALIGLFGTGPTATL